ncbi:ABC transporter substrate-binding protein [Fodinicola acaciae]|uniref:ABC transporter substrate-binding protein n=1 Tax=Fodinicola acaciae TaxID=2681555 RepID=UPI0013D0EC08|nr:ABC transporter substrate-binding protein [Fodinicola acaciae]
MNKSRALLALTAAVALVAAACNANPTSSTNGGAATKGGTLHILYDNPTLKEDPAKSQSLAVSSIHLILRSLTTWQTSPDQPAKVVGDLATDTGTPSDGGKTWTYHLKPGVLYEDGKKITAQDVKYSVERTFAPQLSEGLAYHKTLLVGGDKYKGPFSGQELPSIETPNDSTIIFHLNKPFGDWPWIVSMPAFTGVPKAKEDIVHYQDHPVANGPYKVQSAQQGSKIVLVRNDKWDQKTDPVRTALPDSIVLDMALDDTVINQRVIADSGADKSAFSFVNLQAALAPKVLNNPQVKSRLAISPSGALKYLALNTRKAPLNNPDVRRAIEYAVDKNAVQIAAGGPVIAGDIATTLIEPGIPGYQKYDLYPAPPAGDPNKAKQLLAQAKFTQTAPLVLLTDNVSYNVAIAQAVQASLQKAGIKVTIKSVDYDSATADSTSGKPLYDISLTSWLPDFPSAQGSIQPLFASSEIGNNAYNIAQYSNPQVDAAINTAIAQTDLTKAGQQWAALDKQIMQDAPVVPLYYAKNAFLRGSNVANFYLPPYPPYPSTLTVGLSSSK